MKLSNLIEFFENAMSADVFAQVINAEVDAYKRSCLKLGASAEVFLYRNAEQRVEIDKIKLSILCHAYLSGAWSEWDVYYVCDVLLLDHEVFYFSDDIRQRIEEMTDPTVNGDLSKERVKRAMVSD